MRPSPPSARPPEPVGDRPPTHAASASCSASQTPVGCKGVYEREVGCEGEGASQTPGNEGRGVRRGWL